MKKYIYLCILPLMSMIHLSCEQEVKIDLPRTEPKLVLVSFISPQDTVLIADVLKTIPLFEKTPLNDDNSRVDDATIIISNASGTKSVKLYYNEEFRKYFGDIDELPIIAGETYFIHASTPDGMVAEGSCTVPLANNSLNFTYEKKFDPFREVEIYYVYSSWTKSPQDDYGYRIYGEVEYVMSDGMNSHISYNYMYTPDYMIRADKTNYNKTSDFYYYPSPGVVSQKIQLYLMTVDEHYYRYHLSLLNYDSGNPFAEPSLPYTNIVGGLGVFSAFNSTLLEQEFE